MSHESETNLTFQKLENLKPELQKLYGENESITAMNKLQQFYQEEAFDDEDITNDWIAKDFKNSHGIHTFVSSLNYQMTETDKNLLFDWFCHWLLDNVPRPDQPPKHPIIETPGQPTSFNIQSEDPIETVAEKFRFQLKIEIDQVSTPAQIANNMAQYFVSICKKEEFTQLDQLESDFEDVEDSCILSELMEQYSQYSQLEEKIFYMLQKIIKMLKWDNYPPFYLKNFKCKFGKQMFDRANKLCMHFIPSFFHNRVEFKDLKTARMDEKKDDQDLQLMNGKALDFENNFPLLINLFDAYSRFRADSNKRFWQSIQMTPKSDKQNHHESVTMKANEWWQQKCGYAKYLKKQSEYIYTCLENALLATGKRPLPQLNFNHVVGDTIFDSYDIYTRYVCAFNHFLHNLLGSENGTAPFQIDLWIIPRLIKAGIHHDHQLPPDFDAVKMEWLSDDENDEETSMGDIMAGKIQALGKNEGAGGNDGKIWDIEENLKGEGGADDYKFEEDYWKYPGPDFSSEEKNNFGHPKLVRDFTKLWEMYTEYIDKKKDDLRYKRFILIIDRRDPTQVKNEKMVDTDVINKKDQTWSDKMYLIRPKKYALEVRTKTSGNKNNYQKQNVYRDEICKLYDFTMNETFIGNTMEYLFPMSKLRSKEYRNDFTGLDSGNGYKFVISYHIHFCNKVKMYWYFGQGAIRFFMKDIEWLWPRYFNPDDDNDTSESFQKLSHDAKKDMVDAKNKYPLVDRQYEQFAEQLQIFQQYH